MTIDPPSPQELSESQLAIELLGVALHRHTKNHLHQGCSEATVRAGIDDAEYQHAYRARLCQVIGRLVETVF